MMNRRLGRKSNIAVLALVFTLSFAMLTGCGKKDKGGEETNQNAAVEEATEEPAKTTPAKKDNTDTAEGGNAVDSDDSMTKGNSSTSVEVIPLLFDYEWKDDYAFDNPDLDYYVEMKADLVTLSNETAAKYPELNDTLAKRYGKEGYDLRAAFDEYDENIHKAIDQGEWYGDCGWFYYRNADVARSDSRIVSIRTYEYSYMGGVHPCTFSSSDNYNPQTGEMLKISDVVTDPAKLEAMINKMLDEKYPDTIYFEKEETIAEYFAKDTGLNFTIGNHGMDVVFSPYEIASYADGELVVNIPFKGNESLFNSKYLETPAGSAYPRIMGRVFYADVDGNGEADEILVAAAESEYDYNLSEGLCVSVNNNEIEDEIWFYNATPILVQADGKTYLYVETRAENDYSQIMIYDLSSGKPDSVGLMNGSFDWEFINDDMGYYEIKAFDPTSFKINSRLEALSTGDGYKTYHVGEKGMPETDDEYYFWGFEHELTLKKSLTVNFVDEKTCEEGDLVTLNPGDIITFYRTDNDTFVDVKLEDGRLVRLHVELDDWPQKVEGRDVEMVLDGVIYAG